MHENDLNKLKYKLVLKPIMFSIVGFLVFYSLFHWVSITYFYDFEFAEEYLNRKLYLLLIGFLNLIVIIPRFSLIYINNKNYSLKSQLSKESDVHPKNWALKYIDLLFINIGILLLFIFTQDYINMKSSKITHLEKFSDFKDKTPSKYYKSKNYHLEFEHIVYISYLDTTQKGSRTSRYYTLIESKNLFLIPIYNFKNYDSSKDLAIGWICSETPLLLNNMNYNINNNSKSTLDDSYFIRLAESSYYFGKFNDLIELNTNIDHKNLLFEFKNEKFEDRINDQSEYLFSLFIIVFALLAIFLNDVVFYPEKIERLQNGESIYYICLPDFIQKK